MMLLKEVIKAAVDQKHSKSSNIVENVYKLYLIPVMVKLNFQHQVCRVT